MRASGSIESRVMLSHVLLILTLLLQPLTLPLVGSGGNVGRLPGMDSCCKTVVTASCCGEPIVEMLCLKTQTDEPCRCGVQRREAPTEPPAPMPQRGNDLLPVFQSGVHGVIVRQPAAARASAPVVKPGAPTTHNRTRALLGIWRA